MILIALGSNIEGPWGTPQITICKALQLLDQWPTQILRASSLIETAPYGNHNQPRFVNAVAILQTALSPDSLLRRLHMIERQAGRKRGRRWGPRTLDLDIIDYHGQIRAQKTLVLPHPGVADRSFVLIPIAEIAPNWKHPLTRQSAKSMIQKL
jgi:2-amino-4-hydroxy-6-hydroxymethyldihydropteridine diphosphokinase